jgi:DNA-binding transcriptional ArsR family regulator
VLNYAGLDRVFQALADPSRRDIVERLSRGPATVSELARPLAMSLPAVVQHLHVLEASGLIASQKVGRVRTCRIEPTALDSAQSWITARKKTWESRLDRLGDFLAESGPDADPESEAASAPASASEQETP